MQTENISSTCADRTRLGESRWALWSPHGFTTSIRLCWYTWKAKRWFSRHQFSDRGCNSMSGRWVWQQVYDAFVLCLSPLWRYNSAKVLKETRKRLILFLTEALPNSLSPLPGCSGRSVSLSSSDDMISHNITLGYHQLHCRSPASREQRWAAHAGTGTCKSCNSPPGGSRSRSSWLSPGCQSMQSPLFGREPYLY